MMAGGSIFGNQVKLDDIESGYPASPHDRSPASRTSLAPDMRSQLAA